jgi:hypothetical protein
MQQAVAAGSATDRDDGALSGVPQDVYRVDGQLRRVGRTGEVIDRENFRDEYDRWHASERT